MLCLFWQFVSNVVFYFSALKFCVSCNSAVKLGKDSKGICMIIVDRRKEYPTLYTFQLIFISLNSKLFW